MLALRILEIVFPIFAVVAFGLFWGRRHAPEMETLNRLNISLFVPCLMFSVLVSQPPVDTSYLALAAGVTLVMLGSGAVAWLTALPLGMGRRTLMPPSMFRNAGNLGLPLMVLAFGDRALPSAVIMFLVANTLHFSLGIYLLDHRARIWKVLTTPIVLVNALALTLNLIQFQVPKLILQPLDMLGQVAVPLMLFSLGVRLARVDLEHWRQSLAALGLMLLTGLGVATLLLSLLPLDRTQQGVLFLFGILPPAVLNYLLAEYYDVEPEKVASLVLLGNALAVLTIPLALAFALPRFG
ncbi:MAG: AEC family transporter [Gammaproteobacteria bacterium]|nr:MAG: AEC family transporter [Gammaproteobacteria bacterium]